ncbi:PDDEXK family nuclease [Algicola sagamiensis]|uniref:VRR-NUC domain-containing protein n=1 Tax=Algicola sagamiensis TaxID=163869 RepID=UPI00037BA3CE|nr:VRR-NUC domain-containing protein [Algicola sagamiensis]
MSPERYKESEIEAKFVKLVKNRGGMTRKYTSPGQRGVPDRLVIWPGGHVHFIELKTEKGVLSALQKKEQQRLQDLACTVMTLSGMGAIYQYMDGVDHVILKKGQAA